MKIALINLPAIGRRVSRAEALRMARRALERAEIERLELADVEAARGITP